VSDYTVISAVSNTLFNLLKAGITDSTLAGLTTVPIFMDSPKDLRDKGITKGVSVWLYRVTRNPDLTNQPPRRSTPDKLLRQPLPLDLYYLVTPIATDPEDLQTLLGRVAQIFNDNAILRGAVLQDVLHGSGKEIRLLMEMLTLDELTRVWHALIEPYQLSLSYVAQLVSIDSDHDPLTGAPVLTREMAYAQILGNDVQGGAL
jgi:hypothetical protein